MPIAEMEYVTGSELEPAGFAELAAPIAELLHVTKRFGSGAKTVTALDGLSLALRPGEIVALLGPNGAGKSTAVRTLLGLSTPTSGKATLFGRDPRQPSTRAYIGAMLQVASVPRTLTVREHIESFRCYYPAPLPFAEIVRIAQLDGIEERLFDKLSGGQKQRLLFGLAICGDPQIVFLDEPTVGMDIEARRGLWEQIRSLAARGKTVLLTTHYLEEADALAHRIVVIDKGRVVSEGTPAQIKNHIKSRSGGRTIRCSTKLTKLHLMAYAGVLDLEQNGMDTTITTTHPEDVLRQILRDDSTLCDLEVKSPGLEEAFLALTHSAQ